VINAFQIDVLSDLVDAVDVLVPPKYNGIFLGLHCTINVDDVQEKIDFEEERLQLSRQRYFKAALNDSDAYHQTYHEYDEILEKLTQITRQYPAVSSLAYYGTSLEGRSLPVVRIKGTTTGTKQTVYINGGIHAREWVSAATSVYIIQNLAEKYGSDAEVTRLLNAIEFVITPMSNPDGYAFTWSDDRLWRKNRRVNTGSVCRGVDLNRNFDVYWGTGSSNVACAEDFHGTAAGSEPEVKAIQTLVSSLSNKIGAIDIHAYGQYILRPYGWTNSLHPQETTLKALGDAVAAKIRATTGTVYSSIRSAQLYPVSGASDDWFTVKLGLWGYCFELRDTGRYGFRLPEDQILGTGQEIFQGVLTYASYVLANF